MIHPNGSIPCFGFHCFQQFEALGNLIQSLERVSALELGSAASQNGEVVEPTSVLDEFRRLIETACHESKIEVQ